jgi:hypothetical protein
MPEPKLQALLDMFNSRKTSLKKNMGNASWKITQKQADKAESSESEDEGEEAGEVDNETIVIGKKKT